MRGGDLREDFSIKSDVALLEFSHEFGVARSERAGTGADANLLKATIVALLELAIDVGVVTSFGSGDLCKCDAVLTSPHHALGTGEYILASLDAMGSTFYARHRRGLGVGDKRLNAFHVFGADGEVASFSASRVTAFTAVEVTLAILSFKELAGSSHLDAL